MTLHVGDAELEQHGHRVGVLDALRDELQRAPPVLAGRGALALQDRLPALPASGVLLQATVGALDLDAWQQRLGALAGGSGGDDGEASLLPSQIALRTQQIIAFESGVADTIDPLAGSYLVEYLTDEIERCAENYIRTINDLGGALKAIETGFIQGEIQEAAYREQAQVESKAKIVVGLNEYATAQEVRIPVFRVDPRIEEERRRKLQQLRHRRDDKTVERTLADLETSGRGDINLIPPILEAVKAYATIGEICTVLRRVFGEHREIITV